MFFASHNRAISILEVLCSVSILAVVMSVAVPVQTRIREGAELTKLQNDVKSLNASVSVYLASGGNLDGLTSVQDVLDRLKMKMKDCAGVVAGMTGSTVDQRVKAKMQTSEQAASDRPRAVWNSLSQRFEIAFQGQGVAAFVLDERMAHNDYGEEERDVWGAGFAQEDGWLWVYEEAEPNKAPAPTQIALTPVTGDTDGISGLSQTATSETTEPTTTAPGSESDATVAPSVLPVSSLDGASTSESGGYAPSSYTAPLDNQLRPPSVQYYITSSEATDTAPTYVIEMAQNGSGGDEARIRYVLSVRNGADEVTYAPIYYDGPISMQGDEFKIVSQVIPILGSGYTQSDEVTTYINWTDNSTQVAMVTPTVIVQ